MSNYIFSYDLDNASSSLRENFKNELMNQGWTIWERRTIDNDIRELPDTTMLIKNKTDASVVSSIKAAADGADLEKKGASLSKWIISEYRRVYFESDVPLSKRGGKSGDLLRQMIDDVLLPK